MVSEAEWNREIIHAGALTPDEQLRHIPSGLLVRIRRRMIDGIEVVFPQGLICTINPQMLESIHD